MMEKKQAEPLIRMTHNHRLPEPEDRSLLLLLTDISSQGSMLPKYVNCMAQCFRCIYLLTVWSSVLDVSICLLTALSGVLNVSIC